MYWGFVAAAVVTSFKLEREEKSKPKINPLPIGSNLQVEKLYCSGCGAPVCANPRCGYCDMPR
jgi:hypothetical protein